MECVKLTRSCRRWVWQLAPAVLALLLVGAAAVPRRAPMAPPPPKALAAPVAPEETDEAMLARFAAAMTTGEVRGLKNFVIPQEADDEELLKAFVEAFRAECRSPDAFPLVSFARISPEKLFACYFAGRPGAVKKGGPFMVFFERFDTQWKTSFLPQIRNMARTDMRVEVEARRALAHRLIHLRFGSFTLAEFSALLNAHADACAVLSKPPYDFPLGPEVVESMRKQARHVLSFVGRPWTDIEKTLVAEAGDESQFELGDSYLGLYLEAHEGARQWEIPYAGKEGEFAAERFPFLTDEDVIRASVVGNVESGERLVAVKLSSWGKGIFSSVTLGNAGRKLAIVVDGEVVATTAITSPITNGEMTIDGDFTTERASAIAARLNTYRANAMARFKEMGGKAVPSQPK